MTVFSSSARMRVEVDGERKPSSEKKEKPKNFKNQIFAQMKAMGIADSSVSKTLCWIAFQSEPCGQAG